MYLLRRQGGITQMNFTTLQEYRQELYRCFKQGRDSLFNLADALLTEPQAHSLVELALSPYFERQWGSLYQALQEGKLEQARFEQVLVKYAPQPPEGERVVLAVDATNIERPFSATAPDRGYLYGHNQLEGTAITVGWQFSTVVSLPPKVSSHTYLVSNRRIPTSSTPAQVAAEQLKDLRPHFRERPLSLGDRYYPTKEFIGAVAEDYDLLLRLKTNRVFYGLPTLVSGARGRPPSHGARFQCNDPTTHGVAAEEWEGEDEAGGRIVVSCWQALHLRENPPLPLSVIRVQRYGASGKRRDPRESWFVWIGKTPLALSQVWGWYKRRYAIEHGFRFDKQDLLWTKPRLRQPEQFELWTALVSLVHNQLIIAQGLDLAELRGWESRQRPASPQQIRGGLAKIMPQLGTPARPSLKRGKGQGRAFGAKLTPALRHKVVKKGLSRSKTASF
jgi:DDE superfamily endonuclease